MSGFGYLDKYGISNEDKSKLRRLRNNLRKHAKICAICKRPFQPGEIPVMDHIKPHRGNIQLLLDPLNFQPLHKRCHDSHKKLMENNAHKRTIGIDGWPI